MKVRKTVEVLKRDLHYLIPDTEYQCLYLSPTCWNFKNTLIQFKITNEHILDSNFGCPYIISLKKKVLNPPIWISLAIQVQPKNILTDITISITVHM